MGLSPNLVHTFFCLWKNPEIATSKSSSTRLKLKWVRDVVNVYKRSLAQVCFKVYFQVQEQAKLSIYIYIYTHYPELLLTGTLGQTQHFQYVSFECCDASGCLLGLMHGQKVARYCSNTKNNLLMSSTQKKPWVVRSLPRSLVFP